RPKFRIELPGNPILGDGKSDDRNHATILYCVEYLQLIDTNQDNYLKECLRVRNICGELEQYHTSGQIRYAQWGHQDFQQSPITIAGARRYIFSDNISATGRNGLSVLSRRVLSHGSADSSTIITLISPIKAQEGLHLTSKIFPRRGKGRDLGFGTVLNFQNELGNGMAGQMLCRKHYYLSTQLSIDCFLDSFYYGHPGFHINIILVILAVRASVLTWKYFQFLSAFKC
ncbi:1,3-beta-D-glucan synthase, partial [Ceratobasidium sp. 428]